MLLIFFFIFSLHSRPHFPRCIHLIGSLPCPFLSDPKQDKNRLFFSLSLSITLSLSFDPSLVFFSPPFRNDYILADVANADHLDFFCYREWLIFFRLDEGRKR